MGQCLSAVGASGDTPERFRVRPVAGCRPLPARSCLLLAHHRPDRSALAAQDRWHAGGLGPHGLGGFGDGGKYAGEAGKPAYTTTVRAASAACRSGGRGRSSVRAA